MNLNIITRCVTPDNLLKIKKTIFDNIPEGLNINWYIIFDTIVLKDIDADLLHRLDNNHTHLSFKKCEDYNLDIVNDIICNLQDWIYLLDDDNIIHHDFYQSIFNHVNDYKKMVFLFNQEKTNSVHFASFENFKEIDISQYIIHSSLFKRYRFGEDYTDIRSFIENLYFKNKDQFMIINEVLCYCKKNEFKRKLNLPKVLLVGSEYVDLKTFRSDDYESKDLIVKSIDNDDDIFREISLFQPNSIVTIGEHDYDYPKLYNAPLQIRSKWIHNKRVNTSTGENAYWCGMINSMLKENELISFITPFYNTGNKILRTYESLKKQTYTNWEWVLVNDSTDGGKTLKIIENICEIDPRVKIYDFRKKTHGIIGESKYRGFSLSNGYLLAELDHDDELTPDCAEYLYKASKKFEDCGFFYTNCAEVDVNFNSLKYPDGFSFGYGKYIKQEYNGYQLDVVDECNINPKTIRHIVGVPKHIKAWRRETYFKIGGHNRNLPVADDYELIVRTFLETRFVKIPKLGYIKYIYNNDNERNTLDLYRPDIQRRVRTILEFYNLKIKERFEELGFYDWAYNESPTHSLHSENKFGNDENYVNFLFED